MPVALALEKNPRITHQPVSQEHRVNSAKKKTTQVKASQSWPHDGPPEPVLSLMDHVCTARQQERKSLSVRSS